MDCSVINYPAGSSIADKLHYYLMLNDSNKSEKVNIPGLECREIKKETLLLIGKNDALLNRFFKIFPFANYDLIGYLPEIDDVNKEQILKVDRILDLCPNDGKVKKILDQYGINSKNIYYQKTSVPYIGTTFCFNFGNLNPGKKIAVLVPELANGLIWNAKRFGCANDLLKEYICFADLQNFINQHISPKHLGMYNPWTYYFKQLSDISLDEIYHSENVTICDNLPQLKHQLDLDQLSERMDARLNKSFKELKYNPKKTLGVFLRGSDYAIANWHPIPFDADEAIAIAELYMKKYGLSTIFLDTEDEENLSRFKDYFKDKLRYLPRRRYSKVKVLPHAMGSGSNFDGLKVGEEYLLETLLVSRTFGVISSDGTSSGAIRDYGKKYNTFFDMILTKNKRNSWGSDPVVVKSFNKNLLYLPDSTLHNKSIVTISDGVLELSGHLGENLSAIENVEIYVNPEKKYTLSITVEGDSIPKIESIITVGGTKLHITEYPFIFQPTETFGYYSLNIGSLDKNELHSTIKIQLEEGIKPTVFTRSVCSITNIPVKDVNNLYYREKYVSGIDFESGTITVNGLVKALSNSSKSLYNNIVRYVNGSIFYNYKSTVYVKLNKINGDYCNNYEHIDTWFLNSVYTVMSKDIIDGGIQGLLNTGIPKLVKIALNHLLNNRNIKSYNIILARYYNSYYEMDPLKLNTINFYENAVKLGSELAENELFDVLWKKDDKQYYTRMFELVNMRAKSGNSSAIERCAKCYRFGKGVDKDLNIAAKLLEEMPNRPLIDELYLFDIYMEINLPNYYKRMYEIVSKYPDSGEALLRMGRLYREGLGVKRDYSKAIEYYDKAYEKGLKWMINEFISLLLKVDTVESMQVLLKLADAAPNNELLIKLKLNKN